MLSPCIYRRLVSLKRDKPVSGIVDRAVSLKDHVPLRPMFEPRWVAARVSLIDAVAHKYIVQRIESSNEFIAVYGRNTGGKFRFAFAGKATADTIVGSLAKAFATRSHQY